LLIVRNSFSQEDREFKQKQREDAKKLEQARAAASQKGPMGKFNSKRT